MDRQAVISELKIIIEDYFKAQGMELVDLICRFEGRDLFLRILADRLQGGITIDDCAYLNKGIGMILDEKNILQERYILEVSSPGLDRPLKTKDDFLRSINKKAKFFLSEKINGKMEWDGQIIGVTDPSVYIDVNGEKIDLPLLKIIKASQIL